MVSNKYGDTASTGDRPAVGGEGRVVAAGQGPFAGLGRAVVRHPWRVIALWIVVAVAVIATSPGLPTTRTRAASSRKATSPSGREPAGQGVPPDGERNERGGHHRVLAGRPWPPDRRRLGEGHGDREDTRTVGTSPASSASRPGLSRRTAWCGARWSRCPTAWSTATGTRRITRSRHCDPTSSRWWPGRTGLTEGVTGSAAQGLDSEQSSNQAEQIVLLATLVLILILLLIIFRSPIIAVLPLIVIAVVSQVATGLITFANKALHFNADSSVSTILIVVLFGIGTDYILFLMFRYRERLRGGEDRKQAMASAVARVGEVISSAAGRSDRRVSRADAVHAERAALDGPGAGDRRLRHAGRGADAGSRGGLPARPQACSGPPSRGGGSRAPRGSRPSAARSARRPCSPPFPGWCSCPGRSARSASSRHSTCPRRASPPAPSRSGHW